MMTAAVWLLNDLGLVWNEEVTGSVFFFLKSSCMA